MTTKLIPSMNDGGATEREVRANPGCVTEIREDVLRDLMTTPHAIERPTIRERADADHPRRRVCV